MPSCAAASARDSFLVEFRCTGMPNGRCGAGYAALDAAEGEQFACRYNILYMRHVFPVGMQGVVGYDADGFDIVSFFAFFSSSTICAAKTCVQRITSGA